MFIRFFCQYYKQVENRRGFVNILWRIIVCDLYPLPYPGAFFSYTA